MYAQLQTLDYVAVAIYVLLMAVVGVLFGLLVKDSGSYFKGGGAIPWAMAAVTNFMGLFSSFVFVAYAGIAYEYGLVAISIFWGFVPACILGGLFLAARWRRTGYTSPTEYLECRFNLPMRQTMSWIGLAMRFLDNMVRLYAIGIFIAVVTPLSLEWSIIISGAIVTLFNLFGGMWSVSIMSTIQFVIMILVTVVLLPLSLSEAGGISSLYDKLPENMHWFNGPKGAPFWFTVYLLMSIIKQSENWTVIQKYFCVRDESAAKKTAYLTGLLFFVFTPVFLLPSVAGPLIVPGIDNPEMSYVAISSRLLPIGIMGILFSSMFAATMSSLNAEYNVMSSVITYDIYKRLFCKDAPDTKLLRVARWSTLLIGIMITLGAIMVKYIGGAFEANKLFTGILAIPLGIPLIFGILFKRPDRAAGMMTIVSGIVFSIVVNLIPSISWELGTILEILLCLVVFFYPYKRRRTEEKEQEVQNFFKRITTPIKEEDKPVITQEYKRVLVSLFVFSFVVAGALFCGMSVPTLGTKGGMLSFVAGLVSIIAALLAWMFYKKSKIRK